MDLLIEFFNFYNKGSCFCEVFFLIVIPSNEPTQICKINQRSVFVFTFKQRDIPVREPKTNFSLYAKIFLKINNPLLSSNKMATYFPRISCPFDTRFFITGRQWSRRNSKKPAVTRKVNYMFIVCIPSFLLGGARVELQTKFSKRRGLTESHFLEGVAGKNDVTFFSGLQVLHKK